MLESLWEAALLLPVSNPCPILDVTKRERVFVVIDRVQFSGSMAIMELKMPALILQILRSS